MTGVEIPTVGGEGAAVLERSRALLLEEIGAGHDLTLVTGPGNLGDELILAGTRALLSGLIHREVWVDQLAACPGDTVLLIGSGGWCRPYHDWMPRALAAAEQRFERVFVLPSSFDVGADAVRRALERTRATVFARERTSFEQIEPLCRARLAPDCAFFYDFGALTGVPASGTLNAFREDREAVGGELTIADNVDISTRAAGLEQWLEAIARHELVRTDRAHVMIAAALIGREVEYAPSAYHKIESIATSWLEGFPVRPIEPPRRSRSSVDPAAAAREHLSSRGRSAAAPVPRPDSSGSGSEVTAVVLARDRGELAVRAVRSVLDSDALARVIVVANNPDAATQQLLETLAAGEARVRLHQLERNLGCAGGRRLGCELVDTEYVLLLDDDAELTQDALGHLVAELERHPDAIGASALVVGLTGRVQHCGGALEWSGEGAHFTLEGADLDVDDARLPSSGVCGWLPCTAALVRTKALLEIPIDTDFDVYYEDNEWSFRVELARPGGFRRCPEALVIHHGGTPQAYCCELERVFTVVELLEVQARFLARHGTLLDVDLAERMPELVRDGSVDLTTVRLLLELVAHRGVAWTATEWLGGGLEPLLDYARSKQALAASERARRELEAALSTERAAREAISAHADHVEAELRSLTAHLKKLDDERAELGRYIEQLHLERDQRAAGVAYLLERDKKLVALEQSKWLRLHGRLRPVIALARRMQALAGSAASGGRRH